MGERREYNDFISDVGKKDRMWCDNCCSWLPKDNLTHTCCNFRASLVDFIFFQRRDELAICPKCGDGLSIGKSRLDCKNVDCDFKVIVKDVLTQMINENQHPVSKDSFLYRKITVRIAEEISSLIGLVQVEFELSRNELGDGLQFSDEERDRLMVLEEKLIELHSEIESEF